MDALLGLHLLAASSMALCRDRHAPFFQSLHLREFAALVEPVVWELEQAPSASLAKLIIWRWHYGWRATEVALATEKLFDYLLILCWTVEASPVRGALPVLALLLVQETLLSYMLQCVPTTSCNCLCEALALAVACAFTCFLWRQGGGPASGSRDSVIPQEVSWILRGRDANQVVGMGAAMGAWWWRQVRPSILICIWK